MKYLCHDTPKLHFMSEDLMISEILVNDRHIRQPLIHPTLSQVAAIRTLSSIPNRRCSHLPLTNRVKLRPLNLSVPYDLRLATVTRVRLLSLLGQFLGLGLDIVIILTRICS